MTSDDRHSAPAAGGTDDPGGLPGDLGNGMSDRSGWYDESGSGMTDTSVFTGNPAAPLDIPGSGALDDTGTTFGTGGDDQEM
ncbi:hypothetical protein [Deinococcus budaensis]|uniref:Uncharacterized protein n=1 Tax=Deinococcus budaensis TaxID=1665626 RepID=A0A7W8GHI0_9DEIO|nr:hypothetical protein [Deinococcus budaensis]MBB5235749.1 hypothetical protein [Deinococcus budaensis]